MSLRNWHNKILQPPAGSRGTLQDISTETRPFTAGVSNTTLETNRNTKQKSTTFVLSGPLSDSMDRATLYNVLTKDSRSRFYP